MIAYLEAQLELRDAWMDDKDLDMEQYMAEMDAELLCMHRARKRRRFGVNKLFIAHYDGQSEQMYN